MSRELERNGAPYEFSAVKLAKHNKHLQPLAGSGVENLPAETNAAADGVFEFI